MRERKTYAIVEGLDGTQETRLVILASSVDGVGAHEAGNGGGNSSAVHAEGRGQGTKSFMVEHFGPKS